ncbi:MAG TPA: ABC transporter permease subunit [Gaiellaceae bacterium]|nr:ABC transporter permease subunit [Gaiellaceae bacterium]
MAAPPPDQRPSNWRQYALTAGFLAPAAVLLLVWIVYPAFSTIKRSFYDRTGEDFVWFDNYENLFTNDRTITAIKNNFLWLLIVPALVTAIGLVFAVLTERVRWAVAFKTAVFMPMAISAFAAAVIWRVMDQKDPDIGATNAIIRVAHDYVKPPGVLSAARPSTDDLAGSRGGALTLQDSIQPGDVALLGLTGIRTTDVPEDAVQAVRPEPLQGGINGVVWRDFSPDSETPGEVEPQELGLPGVTVELLDGDGTQVESASTSEDGAFSFEDVEAGEYRLAIGEETFAQPFEGVSWLGEKLITPAIMFAYIWIWAGFAMVVIAAGLASIPRDTLEAARTDGATEWQVFRRITVPLLAPVLSVVFITMLINVLKVFDIVIALAPGSVQDDANVIALDMWRTSFGGIADFGYGSAIAVFLFALVIPILALNIRRFRREV